MEPLIPVQLPVAIELMNQQESENNDRHRDIIGLFNQYRIKLCLYIKISILIGLF